MFNVMIGPFGHTVLAVRLTEEDAEDYRQGVGQSVRGVPEVVRRTK